MHALRQSAAAVLRTYGVEHAPCVLGVSGGIDSMVMLHCCNDLADDMGLLLHVVHVNYGLRGESSETDQDLVLSVCSSYGIPCHTVRAQPYEAPHIQQIGLEATARELRYEAFAAYAGGLDIPVVLTAHTLDDHAETVIMHLARGSGIQGLSGIPVSRSLPPSCTIVRPLRYIRRSDVRAYAREHGVLWRDDSTNESDVFLRNRIRHHVMPALRDAVGGHVAEGIDRSAEHLRTIASFIDEAVGVAMPGVVFRRGDAITVDLPGLDALHEAVALEVLRRGLELSFEDVRRVQQLRNAQVGSRASLHGNRMVVRERDSLVAFAPDVPSSDPYVVIHADGQYVADDHSLHVRRVNAIDVNLRGGVSTVYIDAGSVCGDVVWRRWEHGDRFRPFGMDGHVLVSDLLTNARVPHHLRNTVRVICDDDGILWVCGIRQAERTRVTGSTTEVRMFHIEQPLLEV